MNRNQKAIERDVNRRRNVVTEQVETVSRTFETAVQAGVATGERFAKGAGERLITLV